MFNIILVDDHMVVRDGIKMLLELEQDITVVAEAANGAEVLNLLDFGIQANLIITDMVMPVMDGLTLLRKVREINPNMKVLILSMMEDPSLVLTAFASGASGYLQKNVDIDELLFAIRQISANKRHLSSEMAIAILIKMNETVRLPMVLAPKELPFFSLKEIEVLSQIADGFTNVEIAEKCFMASRTVEGHRRTMIQKSGTRNTASLIKFAVSNKIIS